MKNDKMSSDKLKELKREFTKFSFAVGLTMSALSLSETNHIESSKDLDKYISEDINFSDVKDAIENNDGLSTKDKKRLLNSVAKLEEKVPYLNVKCLYKNCEKLKIMNLKYIDNDDYAGVFYTNSKIINLKCNDPEVFNHELLHATNNLYFSSGVLSYEKSFESGNSKYSFLREGFNEWFNSSVFETNVYSYHIQVADIGNFKYILKKSDKEFIEMFINGNYKDFVNDLEKYLNKKDADELMDLCSKEFFHEDDSSIDEINRKYSIMAKAYINSIDSIETLKHYDKLLIFHNLHQGYKHYKCLSSDKNALKKFDANMYKEVSRLVREKTNKLMSEKIESKLKHKTEFSYDKKYEFLDDGFIGWANTEFLEKESSNNKMQIADLHIFQKILKMGSIEFAEILTKNNYKDFTRALEKYIDKEEVAELMNLCSKEYKDEDNASLDDINKKYSIMLKAYTKSFEDHPKFDIYNEFYSSYKNYEQLNSNTEVFKKFDYYMMQKVFNVADKSTSNNKKDQKEKIKVKVKFKK